MSHTSQSIRNGRQGAKRLRSPGSDGNAAMPMTPMPPPLLPPLPRSGGYTNILLGVTGSVAAVKAPELVVRLLQLDQPHFCPCRIRVVLTTGGAHFWYTKAPEYNPAVWQQLQTYLSVRTAPTEVPAAMPQEQNISKDGPVAATGVEPEQQQEERRLFIHDATEEWSHWHRLGDPVLHIDLRNWADLLIVAPLSAHSLAKFATGLCDDTLSCIVRAWDFGRHHDSLNSSNNLDSWSIKSNIAGRQEQTDPSSSSTQYELQHHHRFAGGKPILLAPAMNTAMWEHPLTRQQLETIQSFSPGLASPLGDDNHNDTNTAKTHGNGGRGSSSDNRGVTVIEPESKLLACGEMGIGALASIDRIVDAVERIRMMSV